MNRIGDPTEMLLIRTVLLVAVLVGPAFPAESSLAGEPVRVGTIRLEAAWARASIGTSRPAAAYLTIVNEGQGADRLLAVQTPLAARAEIHQTVSEGEVVKMKPVGTVEVPAGATLELKPGGLHIMLMGLHEPLKKGAAFSLTLVFEKNGSGTIEARIAGPGATQPPE